MILTNNLCGVDIDAKEGEENPHTAEILNMFDGTYIERSPSGKGYHILFLCDCSQLPVMKDAAGNPIQDKNGRYKLDGYSLRNDKIGVEMYPAQVTNRYFTFTECAVNNYDIVDKTSVAIDFLHRYMDETAGEEPRLSDDEALLQKARSASNGRLFTELYD